MNKKLILLTVFIILNAFMTIFAKCEAFGSANHQEVIEKIIKSEVKVDKVCVDDLRQIYEKNLTIHKSK